MAKLTLRCTLAYITFALSLYVSDDFHVSGVVAPFDLCHMMTSRDHAHFRFLRYGVPKNFIWLAISREPCELSPKSFRHPVPLNGPELTASTFLCTLAYIVSRPLKCQFLQFFNRCGCRVATYSLPDPCTLWASWSWQFPFFTGEYWSSFYVDVKSWKLYFGVLWPRLPRHRHRPFPTTSNTCKSWPQWSCTWRWRHVTIPTSGFRDTRCRSISFESRYLRNRSSYRRDLFAVSYLSTMRIFRRGVLWPTSPRRRPTAYAVGVWRLRSRWV